MISGYMGKMLFVDLTTGKITVETPDDSLYRDFMGGPGIGAKVLYDRMKPGVDALGPDNMLGFVTGPLTGSPANTGARYTVVCKSPITGGWGDANSGGVFGPTLKFAGFDAVFFTGISPKPVYLIIDNGKAELRDAAKLWGKDAYEAEKMLRDTHGKGTEVACIGQSGESVSLISCIVTEKGAAAARSGVGAVMGSKRLKAVAARGDQKVPIADMERSNKLKAEHILSMKTVGPQGGMSFLDNFHTYGTGGMAGRSAQSGDTPVKNWGGVGVVDFPDVKPFEGDNVIANVDKRVACWHCPIGCQASLKDGKGDYEYPAGTRRPEYETLGSFGTMLLNNNVESIAMCNHICNSYGLDTISAGTVIAFAIECYENGLINKRDTGGIELTWGGHKAIVDMTWKMAKREGFGDVLADGVKVAAEKIGKGSEKYAVHIGGAELGMHDPKLPGGMGGAASAAKYQMDATPGRHTAGFGPGGFRGHIVNAAGVCTFGTFGGRGGGTDFLVDQLAAVTGLNRSADEILKVGERIANIRHVFNLREGINPLKIPVHPRIIGDPPQTAGPLKGIRADIEAQNYWNLGQLDWDRITTKPSKKKLLELGLNDVAEALWPPMPPPGPRRG